MVTTTTPSPRQVADDASRCSGHRTLGDISEEEKRWQDVPHGAFAVLGDDHAINCYSGCSDGWVTRVAGR